MKTPRHLMIKGWDRKKFSDTTVVIGGAGAVGSQLAITLARIGIGKIIVIDADILEEHNIANQAYTRKHMGMSKVSALKEIIGEIGDTEFVGVRAWVQDVNFELLDADIILGCFDNVGARFFLNMIAVTSGKPYIDAGVEEFSGSVRVVIPGKTPCLSCYPSLLDTGMIVASCSTDPIPFAYFTASYAAALQAMQVVKIVFDKPVDSYTFFDIERGMTNHVELKRNENCELCGGI